MIEKYNILVGQSGGPTAVINASLSGVIRQGFLDEHVENVYGMIHGIEGFLEGKIINLNEKLSMEDLDVLRATPAAYLGSCRYKMPDDLNSPVYADVLKKLGELNIGAFFYIGGNDSMDTVDKLSQYAAKVDSKIRFIGVPKTIDNDLVNTDHTPGYGSAAKYVATTVREIVWDCGVYKHPSVTIVELMGRHAGWVTAASKLARTEYEKNPLYIYMPESAFDTKKFIEDIREALTKNSYIVVCVSEGIADKDGKFICEYSGDAGVDKFGHKMLTGCGKYLETLVKTEIGCKCRSIELNLPQRCSASQMSRTDIDEAERVGIEGVKAALRGETGKMVAMKRVSLDGAYAIEYGLTDAINVSNAEKKFPLEWITDEGRDISDEFLDYVLPLIQGENCVKYENGLPQYLKPAYL